MSHSLFTIIISKGQSLSKPTINCNKSHYINGKSAPKSIIVGIDIGKWCLKDFLQGSPCCISGAQRKNKLCVYEF